MFKYLLSIFALLIVVGAIAFINFNTNKTPTVRTNIKKPIYTVGELSTYTPALKSRKKVVKFGPLFFGLYNGGLAFPTPKQARSYLTKNDWDLSLWSVYELSGDYTIDVTNGFINKSLLVIKEIP